MSSFRDGLASPHLLLLDGGLGTLLMAAGLPAGTPPELWNVDNPDAVRDAHRAYVEAGSDAVHANTFGANPLRLAHFGLSGRVAELNQAGVALARAARARYVIGDMGTTGDFLPPVGQGNVDAWRDAFLEQAKVLHAAGVDAFHIETMMDRREASVALAAVRSVAPEVPVMVSLTFDRKKKGFFTAFGDQPVKALAQLAAEGAAAVGANCSLASTDMAELVSQTAPSVPALVVQPNAGRPRQRGDRCWYEEEPDSFAQAMVRALAPEVTALGGCCGTTPAFISALRCQLDRLS
jgi:methionine synthase I (cobalamin-dependent)